MKQPSYQIGVTVKINLLELNGYITAICIRNNNYISYEVSFFSNGEYNQKWFDVYEITPLVFIDTEDGIKMNIEEAGFTDDFLRLESE